MMRALGSLIGDDRRNLGGPNAGATTTALCLTEFVAGPPWAYVDVLAEFAVSFGR